MPLELLDRPDARVPEALLDAVVRHYRPRQVILFGSRGRGDAGSDSDWDLLVVVDDGAPVEGDWNADRRWRGDAHVFAHERAAFEAKRDVVGSMANMADEDGVVVWRRPGLPHEQGRRRRVVPKGERWAEAGRWFDRAEKDLRAARLMLAAEPDLVENAAFHLQQAAEKLLKGLLVAKAERFRKVHRLGELAGRAAELFPSLAPDLEGLDPFTSWVVAGRYDDGPKKGAPITRENVEWLTRRCDALLAGARALQPKGTR
jgi:HEPN domain-containing protein